MSRIRLLASLTSEVIDSAPRLQHASLQPQQERPMQRRELLNTLAFAGATLPAAILSEAAMPSSRARTSATRLSIAPPFVAAHDGTRLYCSEWGTGRPVLFLNSAGL